MTKEDFRWKSISQHAPESDRKIDAEAGRNLTNNKQQNIKDIAYKAVRGLIIVDYSNLICRLVWKLWRRDALNYAHTLKVKLSVYCPEQVSFASQLAAM